MKTALTGFIEYLESIQERDKIPSWVITTGRNYLQSEKQQIEKTWDDAFHCNVSGATGEEYYKQTYGNICEACNGTGLVDGDCIEDKESCFNCLGRGSYGRISRN